MNGLENPQPATETDLVVKAPEQPDKEERRDTGARNISPDEIRALKNRLQQDRLVAEEPNPPPTKPTLYDVESDLPF